MKGDDEARRKELSELIHDIVPYLMQHNAEAEACDILMEVEKLGDLEQYVDESAYPRVCLYLRRYTFHLFLAPDLLFNFLIQCDFNPLTAVSRDPAKNCL